MDWDSAIRRAQRSPTLIKFRAAHGMEPRDLSNMLRSDEETFEDAQRSDLPMAGEQIMVETQEMFYNISDEETFVDAQRSDLPMAGEPIMVETHDDNQFDDKQSQAQGMFYNIFDDKQSQAQNELERALALSLLDVKNSCPDSEPAQSRARTSSPRRTYVAAGCLVEDTYGEVSWLQESSPAETAGEAAAETLAMAAYEPAQEAKEQAQNEPAVLSDSESCLAEVLSDSEPSPKRFRLKGKQTTSTVTSSEHAANEIPENVATMPRGIAVRSSELAATFFGVSARTFRRLRASHAPLVLFQLLWFIKMSMGENELPVDLQFADMYMGVGHLKSQFEQRGFNSVGFEISHDPVNQDALSVQGFLTMLVFALRLLDGVQKNGLDLYRALQHWGTVCSSWIYVSMGSTGRSRECPEGDENVRSVRAGNIMVARMFLVLWLLRAKGVGWILEQPGSSLMEYSHRARQHFDLFGVTAVRTWMGAFGGPHCKPTQLKGSVPWLAKLSRPMTSALKKRIGPQTTVRDLSPGADGRRRMSGAPALKSSQVYPVGYAIAVAEAFTKAEFERDNDSDPEDSASESDSELQGFSCDAWNDADMAPVLMFMKIDPSWVPPPLRRHNCGMSTVRLIHSP